jgi:acyl dehydratase
VAEDLNWDIIDTEQRYGPYKYPLADRIGRYLEAVQNEHPWHRERSPWGPPVAPPTILAAASLRFIDAVATVPPGTLHASQELETAAALRLDRQPIGYGRFTEKYERRGRRWFDFEIHWRDETGLILGRTCTTMTFPGIVDTKDEGPAAPSIPKPADGELPAITRVLSQERITAYTEDSANALRGQSIHIHPDIAKAAGFEATVAQGMMAADYMSEIMTNAFRKDWFASAGLSVTFLKPMLCGDMITVHAVPSAGEPVGAVVRKKFSTWAENQRGETVAAGTAFSLVMPVNEA